MSDQITMRDAIKLYSEHRLGIRLFVRLRNLLSPLEVLENLVPKEGNILDLGCGHGLFTNYMALRSRSRNILGLDPSAAKIEVAKKTESIVPNVHYLLGDVNNIGKEKPFDTITIVDVLYLLTENKQREILKTCHQLLSRAGVLVLKTQDTRPRWRFFWTYMQEMLVVGIGVTMSGNGLHFMPVVKTKQILEEAGFLAEHHRLPSRIFYPNVVFICRKRNSRSC
jgi:2-polyprenyl-3-methyl-5-hydroxy-6-metoxy-1,4-benzoquinol methylase